MSPRRVSPTRHPFGAFALGVSVPGALLLGALVLGACGGEDTRDPAAFCERLRTVQPALTDPNDPVALLALYDDLDDHAPLQIRDDWHQITVLLTRVNSYDPTDTAETQEVQQAVLRSQAAVTAVAVWARDSCQIDLGPIPTTVPIGGTGDQLLSDQPPDTSAASDDTGATDDGSTDTVADTAASDATG